MKRFKLINADNSTVAVNTSRPISPRPVDTPGDNVKPINWKLRTVNQSINQYIYIAPLQDIYSEALPNQACSKRKVLTWLRNDPEES